MNICLVVLAECHSDICEWQAPAAKGPAKGKGKGPAKGKGKSSADEAGGHPAELSLRYG